MPNDPTSATGLRLRLVRAGVPLPSEAETESKMEAIETARRRKFIAATVVTLILTVVMGVTAAATAGWFLPGAVGGVIGFAVFMGLTVFLQRQIPRDAQVWGYCPYDNYRGLPPELANARAGKVKLANLSGVDLDVGGLGRWRVLKVISTSGDPRTCWLDVWHKREERQGRRRE